MKLPQQSPHFPDSFYRIGVKGLYVQEGKVLLTHDISLQDREPIWELPGGGVDFNEPVIEALKREIKEEMGLTVTSVSKNPVYTWTYRRENHRGMEWYYTFLLAYRVEVESMDDYVPTNECYEFKFFSREELETLPDLSDQLKPFAKLFNPSDFL